MIRVSLRRGTSWVPNRWNGASLMFAQVMKKAHVARQRLLRLGIFKEVEVLIDTSEGTRARGLPGDCRSVGFKSRRVAFSSGSDALPNGLDVTFEVTEIKRLTGSYNTMVGNNEGSMVRPTPPVAFLSAAQDDERRLL